MKKDKILFVINDISMPGGLSTVTKQLLHDLSLNRVDIHCLTLANKYNRNFSNSCYNLDMGYLHGLSKIKKILWYFEAHRKIKIYLIENNFDVVVGVGSAMNILLSLLPYLNCKIWGVEHSAYSNASFLRKIIKLICYQRLERLICLTESDAVRYRKVLKHVAVIPNYTPFESTKLRCDIQRKRLLYLGRFTKTKGSDFLASIINIFLDRNPEWNVTLFGEGPEKKYLETELSLHIKSGRVSIFEPSIDVQSEYLSSSVFFMTSRNEGFPMVLLEAQAHGLPIVSFDCETGPSEIITQGEDGYLIPTFDIEAFVQALSRLANDLDSRVRMSKAAIANRHRFSRRKVIELWLEQFKQKL